MTRQQRKVGNPGIRGSTRRYGLKAGIWLGLLGLVVAACGSDDSDSTATPAETAAPAADTTAVADSGETTAPSETTAAAAATDTTEAAAPAEDVPGVTDTEIKFGASLDNSGPAAVFGEGYIAVTDAYFEQINAAGGVHGRELTWVYENDGYDPGTAASNVRRLIDQESVFALLYASGSATNNAMMDYVDEQGVPFLMITSSGSSTDPPKACCFSAITPAELYGAAMVKYASTDLGAKTIAIVYQDDDFGQAGITGARNGATDTGVEIIAEVPHERDATEYSAQVDLLKSAGADVVLMFTTVPPTAGILKQAKAVGFETTWLSSIASANPRTLELAEGAAEGVYFAFVWPPSDADTTDPGLKSFQDLMLSTGLDITEIGQQHAMPFVNVELAVKALEKAGRNLTRESFVAALESMKDEPMSTTAPLTFSAFDAADQFSRLGNTSVGFAIVEDGDFSRITENWINALS